MILNIIIDDKSKLSLYEQIQSQIKAQILSGDIKPGEMLKIVYILYIQLTGFIYSVIMCI